jgi:hypothetical protein
MLACRLYTKDWEIDERLAKFGVKRTELFPIIRAVVAARADQVEDDPITAGGQFAYIYGTRQTRAVFRRKKYLLHREQNIESVKHPDRDLKIVYQSVDLAAVEGHGPQAISGKGAGAHDLIGSAQGNLFSEEELERLNPVALAPVDTGVWFFCVSAIGDDVRAELSLPARIHGGNFNHFIERIFILRGGECPAIRVAPKPRRDVIEFEPQVTRRK